MKRDIYIGIIGGLLGFFLIVLPLLKFIEWAEKEVGKSKQDIVIYVKEMR